MKYLKQLKWNTSIWIGIIVWIWTAAFHQLHWEWLSNPNYSHGWLIPLLSAFLLYRRWLDRPAPVPPTLLKKRFLIYSIFLCTLLPSGIIQEANPDWRFTGLLMIFMAILGTYLFLDYIGGRPWRRFFLIPVLFTLLAVPWPGTLEGQLVNNLAILITHVTTDLVIWMGFPAYENGNQIIMESVHIEIAEACSGIRTFQVTLLFTLFIGEFYRFSPGRRMLLAGIGVGFLIVTNMIRTLILAVIAGISQSNETVTQWHDATAWTVLLFSFLPIVLITGRWNASNRSDFPSPESNSTIKPTSPRSLSPRIGAGILAIFCLWEIITIGWFLPDQSIPENENGWDINWKTPGMTLIPDGIPLALRNYLRFDHGGAAVFNAPKLRTSYIYYLEWENNYGVQTEVWGHQPQICFSSQGWDSLADPISMSYQKSGTDLSFRFYRFQKMNLVTSVFRCEWQNRVSDRKPSPNTHLRRLQAAWDGTRSREMKLLEIMIREDVPPEEAENLLSKILDRILEGSSSKSLIH